MKYPINIGLTVPQAAELYSLVREERARRKKSLYLFPERQDGLYKIQQKLKMKTNKYLGKKLDI